MQNDTTTHAATVLSLLMADTVALDAARMHAANAPEPAAAAVRE